MKMGEDLLLIFSEVEFSIHFILSKVINFVKKRFQSLDWFLSLGTDKSNTGQKSGMHYLH
jgi:hypothetical protein